MSKSIVVVGFGPGISTAVAERFGREGFSVLLVGRTAARLAEGVRALKAKGVDAASFVADAASPEQVRAAIAAAKKAFGTVTAVHWNAYAGGAGDFTTATPEEIRAVLEVPIVGLTTALQAALPDLKAQKGSLLVTNGGFAFLDTAMDRAAATGNATGLSVANAAKHKLVRILAEKLRPDGVYVGEVIVAGMVKGTAFDHGQATLEAAKVAEAFWELHAKRAEVSTIVRG